MRHTKIAALVGTLAVLLAACGPAATATPSPATPTAVATRAPGATPQATPTPAPSPTPVVAAPKYGGVLRVWANFDMREWDIQREPGNATPMNLAANAVFGKLITWAYATEESCVNPLVPILAESYKYVDAQTLDVPLRPGVKFHNKPPVNGRELTARDVVWNFARLKEVAVSGQITPGLGHLDRVEATGPLSVRFYFRDPFAFALPNLLAATTGPFMYASEAAGADGNYRDPDKSWIGTGPFMFKEWRPGVKMGFTRNPNYFKQGKPYLDGLEILVIPDASTQTAAMMAGKLDMQWRASPSSVVLLRQTRPDIRLSGCPYYSGFGTIWIRNDKAPFNDVRVRRALNMAIDRQAIIDALFLGEGEILTLIPSQYGGYSLAPKDLPPEVRRYIEYRPDDARKLLAEAGFPSGFTTTLETSQQFGSPFNESQEAMLAMWAKIGVKVEPKWYERGRYSETTLQGKYDNLGWTRSAEVGFPFNLPSMHSRSEFGANRSRINDPELDKLIDKYTSAFDEKEQMALARQIQARAVDQAYVVQQPSPLEYIALQPYVRDSGRSSHWSRILTLYERIWFDR